MAVHWKRGRARAYATHAFAATARSAGSLESATEASRRVDSNPLPGEVQVYPYAGPRNRSIRSLAYAKVVFGSDDCSGFQRSAAVNEAPTPRWRRRRLAIWRRAGVASNGVTDCCPQAEMPESQGARSKAQRRSPSWAPGVTALHLLRSASRFALEARVRRSDCNRISAAEPRQALVATYARDDSRRGLH